MKTSVCIALVMLPFSMSVVAVTKEKTDTHPVTLPQAIESALALDPWLLANSYRQESALARSVGIKSLPDPKFNVGIKNLPTDTLDYDQEAMTQFSIGVSQMLPRGETLSLKGKKLEQKADQHPLLREERRAAVIRDISILWLRAIKAQKSIELINQNYQIFLQLNDVATSSYSSAFGRTRQQDLVRAELELVNLEDRLTQLKQQRDVALQQLEPWLIPAGETGTARLTIKGQIPELKLRDIMAPLDPKLISHLSKHPRLALFDISIGMASTDLLLAEQKYKPEWIINASYGIRGKTAVGDERSDLFSMGVTIDIPVFSTSRQDSEVKAAITDREALKTERLLLLRELYSRYGALHSDLEKLDKRQRLYEQQLLPGFSESAEAAINAYTVDDGSFAEVVRARISELDAKLTSLGIHVERLKTITVMNYLLTQVGDVEVTEQ